jgi:predicted O-linked N-acetylglucosamine transferase (SPINDLY family)
MINGLNEAITLHKLGKLLEAKKIYKKILKKNPNNFEIINLLGVISLQSKKYDEAIILIKEALKINPNHHSLYNNLGVAYKELKKNDIAIKNFKKAIELNPNYAEAYNNLGIIFKNINQYEESIQNYLKSIQLKANYIEAYYNLGLLYKELKKYKEAIINFNKAIELNPNYIEAYKNRAETYHLKNQYLLSIKDYCRLKEINPEKKYLYETSIFFLNNLICNWNNYKKNLSDLESKLSNNKIVVEPLHAMKCTDSLISIKNNTLNYNKSNINYNLNDLFKKNLNFKNKNKIKIGYYSADFRIHPVGHLICNLLESHNKDNFEIIGFYFNKYPEDKITKRIFSALDKFYYVNNMSDKDIILESRNLGIDIAVDLMGYTNSDRKNIFTNRLAPIQINFLGYPGTTAHNIDYIISDKYLIPSENQDYYFEKIIYMPDCYQPNDSKRISFLSNKHFNKKYNFKETNLRFCYFTDPSKINPIIFNCWMKILRKTQNTVLCLSDHGDDYKTNLINEASKQNIDINRLIFLAKLPYEDYLKNLRSFDLFLDTFPYSSHTTANEVLWSGVPLISLKGQSFHSRGSSSFLHHLGMNELITSNIKDYESLAIFLGNNPLKLKEIKNKLIRNMKTSNVFNIKIYTSNLEKAYKLTYERNQKNLKPENIYLN